MKRLLLLTILISFGCTSSEDVINYDPIKDVENDAVEEKIKVEDIRARYNKKIDLQVKSLDEIISDATQLLNTINAKWIGPHFRLPRLI